MSTKVLSPAQVIARAAEAWRNARMDSKGKFVVVFPMEASFIDEAFMLRGADEVPPRPSWRRVMRGMKL